LKTALVAILISLYPLPFKNETDRLLLLKKHFFFQESMISLLVKVGIEDY